MKKRTILTSIFAFISIIVFAQEKPSRNDWENPEVFQGAEPTIYRSEKSKGWKETWCGRPVKVITDSSS